MEKYQLSSAKNGGKGLSGLNKIVSLRWGVPKENIFNGVKYGKGYSNLDNNAERIILRNIPENSKVEHRGIPWGGRQRNLRCNNCEPHVLPQE
ncbi:hypothetical protein [Acidovorax sp. GBBC 3334]|uniref:hypothetical protein n=1 Tax=Acidovorax sp. GBBC 3334 TaxID=2940496 RepID=UPI003FA4615B